MATEISILSTVGKIPRNDKTPQNSEVNQPKKFDSGVDNVSRSNQLKRNDIAAISSSASQISSSVTVSESNQLSNQLAINENSNVTGAVSNEIKTVLNNDHENFVQDFQNISRNLEFRIDEDSGRTVITVREASSKEVIRQIPSEQALELSRRLKDLESEARFSEDNGDTAKGILFTSST